jgi:hypothetical protein
MIEVAVFEVDRIYSVRSPDSALTEWYFLVRDGRRGPYSSINIARIALNEYVSSCVKDGITNRQNSRRIINRIVPFKG